MSTMAVSLLKIKMNSSSTCFIIDWDSIRGFKEEVRQLNILEDIEALPNDKFGSDLNKTKIITAMITKIQTQSLEVCQIILYFMNESLSSEVIKTEVEQNYTSKNIKVLIGLQALFYFIGNKAAEFWQFKWISKEQAFFSKRFIETANELGSDHKFKVFRPERFEDAITKLIHFY